MKNLFTVLSSVAIVVISLMALDVRAYCNNYCNTGSTQYIPSAYQIIEYPSERYNPQATDSYRHSRIGYWASDPYYDENEYTIGTVRYSDYEFIEDYYTENEYAIVGPNTGVTYAGQQPYPYSYYRGNGGDLRVWDGPFDIVAASAGVRGGVADTYTNYYWGAPAGIGLLILLGVLALGVGAYVFGRSTVR